MSVTTTLRERVLTVLCIQLCWKLPREACFNRTSSCSGRCKRFKGVFELEDAYHSQVLKASKNYYLPVARKLRKEVNKPTQFGRNLLQFMFFPLLHIWKCNVTAGRSISWNIFWIYFLILASQSFTVSEKLHDFNYSCLWYSYRI